MDKSSTPPLKTLFIITISFIVAAMVNIYPMHVSSAVFRPMVLIMVLVFWLIYQPKYAGVITAFLVGLLADLLLDTRLGQQAFSAVLVAFIVKLSTLYIKQLNAFIAWMLACLCLTAFQVSLWLIQYISQDIFMISSVSSLVISMVGWLGVYLLLQRFT